MYLQPRDASSSNNTADALQVLCRFAVSGTYQVMPRVVIYPLILAAICSRTALVVVMLWTSVAAIHVIALAASQSSAVLDTDVLLATYLTFLGLGVAPVYIMHSWGLKGSGRADMFTACLWIVLLWIGLLSYTASTGSQPSAVSCVNAQHHNITSKSMLSECTFQCDSISMNHPMRQGQRPILVTKPSALFYGSSQTMVCLIFFVVLLFFFVIGSFWVAKQKDVGASIRQRQEEKKKRGAKSSAWAYCLLVYKFAFLIFVILIWLDEKGFRNIAGTERNDTIDQWGPLVALALIMFGLLFRSTIGKKHIWTGGYIPGNPPQEQFETTKSVLEGNEGIEIGSMPSTSHASTTPMLSLPEEVHVRDAGNGNNSDHRD